jgi:hypothetical protein
MVRTAGNYHHHHHQQQQQIIRCLLHIYGGIRAWSVGAMTASEMRMIMMDPMVVGSSISSYCCTKYMSLCVWVRLWGLVDKVDKYERGITNRSIDLLLLVIFPVSQSTDRPTAKALVHL